MANQPRPRLHSQLDVGAHSQSVKIAGRELARMHPGVARLSTGARYDPDPANPGFCRRGNPNVLTADRPSSTLSRGCTGQLTLVEIEPYQGTPPELSVTRPPATA